MVSESAKKTIGIYMFAFSSLREEGVKRVRLLLQWSCHWASGHQAGCRAPGSTTPSRRYRSGRQPGQCGRKCTHAGNRKITLLRFFYLL